MAEQKNRRRRAEGAAGPRRLPARRPGNRVTFAKVHVQCSFNNTIVTLTDDRGDVLAWATAGGSGFRGTKKGTPFAAGVTASKVAKKAVEMGVKQVAVFIKGPGPGRETAVRSLGSAGLSSSASRTSRRCRTTAAVRRKPGGCNRCPAIPTPSANCAAASSRSCSSRATSATRSACSRRSPASPAWPSPSGANPPPTRSACARSRSSAA